MSYFVTTKGEPIDNGTFEESGGFQEMIHDGTKLLCAVESVEWSEEKNMTDGTYIPSSINIMLHVIDKGIYQDRIHTHKLHVDADKGSYTNAKQEAGKFKKADRARKLLADYNELCAGKLRKIPDNKFTDSIYINQALAGTELIATFGLIEGSDYTSRSGEVLKGRDNNWIKKIEPKDKKLQEEDRHIERQARNQPAASTHIKPKPVTCEPVSDDYFNDDIPF